MKYLLAVFAVSYLGVELYSIELLIGSLKSSTWTVRRLGSNAEALGKLAYEVCMAHPYDALFGNIAEDKAVAVL